MNQGNLSFEERRLKYAETIVTEEYKKTYLSETILYPPFKIFMILILFAVIICISIMRGSEINKSIVGIPVCSPLYFSMYIIALIVGGLFIYINFPSINKRSKIMHDICVKLVPH